MKAAFHNRLLDKLGRFFDKTCTIKQDQGEQDEYGEVVSDWVVVPGLRDIECLPGTLATNDIVGPLFTATTTNNMEVRVDGMQILLKGYFPQVTNDMRVEFEGEEYAIMWVAHAHDFLTQVVVGKAN